MKIFKTLLLLLVILASVDARASMTKPVPKTTTTTTVTKRIVPKTSSFGHTYIPTVHLGSGGTVVHHGKISWPVAVGIGVGVVAFIGCLVCLRLCAGSDDEEIITTTTTVHQ